MADALQGGQHLGDDGAAAVERGADAALAVVERLETDLRRLDGGFGRAQPAGGVDEILRQLAAIDADLFDLALQGRLGLDRFALPVA
ncbi:MAG TPA: hypothetical protein VGC36_12575, partial [Rhizomicrobium sp.]